MCEEGDSDEAGNFFTGHGKSGERVAVEMALAMKAEGLRMRNNNVRTV